MGKTFSPGSSDSKESACNVGELGFDLWVRKIPWRRVWQPTPVFLPEEFSGQRNLVGYSLWGSQSQTRPSDFHFQTHTHTSKHILTHSGE